MTSHLLLDNLECNGALSAPAPCKDGVIPPAVVGAGSIRDGHEDTMALLDSSSIGSADDLPQEASYMVVGHNGEAGHHLQEMVDMLQVGGTVQHCQVSIVQRHGCSAWRGWREDLCGVDKPANHVWYLSGSRCAGLLWGLGQQQLGCKACKGSRIIPCGIADG